MKKPITAERREKLRKRALFLPAGYIVLGVVTLIGAFVFGEGWGDFIVLFGAVWVIVGIAMTLIFARVLNRRMFYEGPRPQLADGEEVLWGENVNDRQAKFGRAGGLTLTNRRLAWEPAPDKAEPPDEPREWAVDAIRSVSTEDLRPVLYPGDWGGTLVFDVGEGNPQRFRVFDPAASAALIDKALSETRAQTQKGPTT